MSGTQIPLQFRPTPNIGPDFGQAVGDATRVLQLREAQQQAQKGNALQNIMAQPGALDAMGQPTPETMKAVMGVDVNAGLKLRQAQMVNEEQVLRTEGLKSDVHAKKMEIIGNAYDPILNAYDEAVKAGKPPAQAISEAQASLNPANDLLKNGGVFQPEELKQMPTQFDPIKFRAIVSGTKQHQQNLKDQQANRRLDDAEKRESDTGWQVVLDTANLDANGRPTEVEYNPRTNKTRTLGEGKPYQPATPMRISATGQAKEYGKPETIEWTGPDGKKVRKTLEEDKNGGWVDAVTRTPVEVGKDMRVVPAGEISKASGGLDDETADRLALQMAKGQPVSAVMSIRNQADIDKLQNRLTQVYKDQGKTPEQAAELATRAAARWHSVTRTYDQFTSAQQGSPGGQVVAANTAIQHINVAREAAKALGNGDINLANRLWQRIAEETGDPAPTNMNAISQFVSNEVSRASAGAALTGEERSAMKSDLASYRSPAQLSGAMDKFQQLLAGKLNSLRYTYRFGTGIKDPDDPYSFETLVGSPDTLKVLGWDKKGGDAPAEGQGASGAPMGTGGPWKGHAIPDKAIADLKKAPDTAAVFDEHFQSPGLAASILGAKAAPAAAKTPDQPQGTRPATPPSAPTTEGAEQQSWPVPTKQASDPDGTKYNGGEYVKRGDRIVRAQPGATATSPADEAKHLDRARFALKQGAKREDIEKELRAAGIDPGKL